MNAIQLMKVRLVKYWNGIAPGSVMQVFPAVGGTLVDKGIAEEIRRGRPRGKGKKRNGVTNAENSGDDGAG